MSDLPTRKSTITLAPITPDNWRDVTSLVVNASQVDLVPPNFVSLCEHQFYPSSAVQCVLADGQTVVGYIRYEYTSTTITSDGAISDKNTADKRGNHVNLLLFMIHQACQGLGFGTKAMTLLIGQLRSQGVETISLSTMTFGAVPSEDSPEHFFALLGFRMCCDDNRMQLDL